MQLEEEAYEYTITNQGRVAIKEHLVGMLPDIVTALASRRAQTGTDRLMQGVRAIDDDGLRSRMAALLKKYKLVNWYKVTISHVLGTSHLGQPSCKLDLKLLSYQKLTFLELLEPLQGSVPRLLRCFPGRVWPQSDIVQALLLRDRTRLFKHDSLPVSWRLLVLTKRHISPRVRGWHHVRRFLQNAASRVRRELFGLLLVRRDRQTTEQRCIEHRPRVRLEVLRQNLLSSRLVGHWWLGRLRLYCSSNVFRWCGFFLWVDQLHF